MKDYIVIPATVILMGIIIFLSIHKDPVKKYAVYTIYNGYIIDYDTVRDTTNLEKPIAGFKIVHRIN